MMRKNAIGTACETSQMERILTPPKKKRLEKAIKGGAGLRRDTTLKPGEQDESLTVTGLDCDPHCLRKGYRQEKIGFPRLTCAGEKRKT